MSLMGRAPAFRALPPNEFRTAAEATRYMADLLLAEARPGLSFLLVTRFIRNGLRPGERAHGIHEDQLHIDHYIGRFAAALPLITVEEAAALSGAVVLATEKHLKAEGGRDWEAGPLRILTGEFLETPLKEPFPRPPDFLGSFDRSQTVIAVSLAVGNRAMEQLIIAEMREHNLIGEWYLGAAPVLGLGSKPEAQELKAHLVMCQADALKQLAEIHTQAEWHLRRRELLPRSLSERITPAVQRVRKLGLHEMPGPVQVGEFKILPAVQIENLETFLKQ